MRSYERKRAAAFVSRNMLKLNCPSLWNYLMILVMRKGRISLVLSITSCNPAIKAGSLPILSAK
jgi:hypothetical protein